MIRSMVLGSVLVGSLLAAPATAQESYDLAILAGSCEQLGGVVASLDDAVVADGDAVGAASAVPVTESFTTIEIEAEALVQGNHAVVVGDVDDPVACGNVGGYLDRDGGVAFAVLPVDGSDVVGTAYLAPEDRDGETWVAVAVGSRLVPSPREANEPDGDRDASETGSSVDGTRESPIRVGQRVNVGRWEAVVHDVRIASNEEILEENMFNDEAVDGLSFVLVEVAFTNNSDTEDTVLGALEYGVLGPSNVVVTTTDNPCGVIPDELDDFAEVFPGGTVRGNVCFQLNRRELDESLFFVEAWEIGDGPRLWFSME